MEHAEGTQNAPGLLTRMYKLRTIDVWDTLLRRRSHPDFSKLHTARAIYLGLGQMVRDEYHDHWSIYRERCKIEGTLVAEREHGEYSLDEVLELLLQSVMREYNAVDIEKYRQIYSASEQSFELRNTYPDPCIERFCGAWPAAETYFLSDFYMNAAAIQKLLDHHGVARFVKAGISSCDVGFSKRRGQLYEQIHTLYGVEPRDHVHIGDNFEADVLMARKLGVHAVHFEPKSAHSERMRISEYLNNRTALFSHIAQEVTKNAEPRLQSLSGAQRTAYELGLHTAPLFVGFIIFIAEQALKNKDEKVFFFTREGEFFLRIWKALFPDNEISGLELPLPDLLEVSRLATFCASLRSVSVGELRRVWNLYSTQSMDALLKTLGLRPDEFATMLARYNLTLDENIVHPWQDNRVRALFADTAFTSSIEAKVEADRRQLGKYLDSKGFGAAANSAVVDIGWRGTIQDNLGYVRPQTRLTGYYLGLQTFLNEQPANCAKRAYGPNGNGATDHLDLLNVVSLLEMLCNSPNGSVSGYGETHEGQVHAIRIVDDAENRTFEQFVSYFQEAVLQAASVYAPYIDNHVIVSSELRERACEIWGKLIGETHQDLARAYISLSHNELFGVGKFIDKSHVPSLRDIVQGLFNHSRRHEVIQYIRQTQWPQLIWARKELSYIHRLSLFLLMKAALFYKMRRRIYGR